VTEAPATAWATACHLSGVDKTPSITSAVLKELSS